MAEINPYRIKLLSQDDSDSLFELIERNKLRLEDFFAGTLSKTRSLEATREYCKEIENKIEQKSYFAYLIIDEKTNKPIGLVDVKNINLEIPKAELGAFIDLDFEGKGIVREYTNSVISIIVSEHGFKKLLCRAAPENVRSIRVIESIGFEFEGTIRRDYRTTKGELVDLNYYGKIFD